MVVMSPSWRPAAVASTPGALTGVGDGLLRGHRDRASRRHSRTASAPRPCWHRPRRRRRSACRRRPGRSSPRRRSWRRSRYRSSRGPRGRPRRDSETVCVVTSLPPAARTAAITFRIAAAFASSAACAVAPRLSTPAEISAWSGTALHGADAGDGHRVGRRHRVHGARALGAQHAGQRSSGEQEPGNDGDSLHRGNLHCRVSPHLRRSESLRHRPSQATRPTEPAVEKSAPFLNACRLRAFTFRPRGEDERTGARCRALRGARRCRRAATGCRRSAGGDRRSRRGRRPGRCRHAPRRCRPRRRVPRTTPSRTLAATRSCASRNGTPSATSASAASVASRSGSDAASASRSRLTSRPLTSTVSACSARRRSRRVAKTGGLSSCMSRSYASGSPLTVARRPVSLPIAVPALPRIELGDVRVELLRHHRRASGGGLRQPRKPELGRRPEHELLADARQVREEDGRPRTGSRARSPGRRPRRSSSASGRPGAGRPSVEPARAPAPSGLAAAASAAWAKRPRSRSSISTQASRWWPRVTGWPRCRCV